MAKRRGGPMERAALAIADRMTAATPRPAVGYVRVSTEEQARGGVSLDAQESRIRAYCVAHGLTLGTVLVDAGESGKTMDRPQLRVLLDMIAADQVGAVVIYKLDRLTRRTRDLLELVEDVFKRRGIELVSLSEQLDTRTPAGVLMLTLLGALAQLEREQIGERTRTALDYKREQGHRLGTTPLGYRTPEPGADMVPAPGELAAVRHILRRRQAGRPYREIAAELTEKGYATKWGKGWHPATVRRYWQRRARYRVLLDSVA